MGVPFGQPISYPLVFTVDSFEFLATPDIANQLILLMAFRFPIHVRCYPIVEYLVSGIYFLLQFLPGQLMHRLFILPLRFDVLHGREILLGSLMDDLFDPPKVLLVLLGFLNLLKLTVGSGLVT